jgi:MiaB/RimO family radical SAM methylthiotransferase
MEQVITHNISGMTRIYISTNGCEPTASDTGRLLRELESYGAQRVEQRQEAEIAVYLGCTFTRQKEVELEEQIADLLGREQTRLVVVSGCYLSKQGEDPRLHHVRSKDVVEFLKPHLSAADALEVDVAALVEQSGSEEAQNALITISDGCFGSCTFCSIKTVRGTHRSRPVREILADVGAVAKHVGTVKLTGIEVAGYGMEAGLSYGLDTGHSLARLVQMINDAFPTLKIELGSLNPKLMKRMSDAELAVLASDYVTGNLHLPLESASTRVLKEMRRGYTYEEYLRTKQRLEKAGVTRFSTDLIAGFPTETEEDHQASLRFLEEHDLELAQIFFYEPRPGTEAAEQHGLPREIRVDRALALIAQYTASYAKSHGHTLNELISGDVTPPYNTNINLNEDELAHHETT